MRKNKLIKKWLSNKLSKNEREEFKKLPDYKLMVRIIKGSKKFEASYFSKVAKFDLIVSQININKKNDQNEKRTIF